MGRRKKSRPKNNHYQESNDRFQQPFWSSFDGMKILAYGLIFAVSGIGLWVSGSDFLRMWSVFPPTIGDEMLYVARIVLFAELVVLVFRWIIATHYEYEMWKRWLENPVQKQRVYAALFGLAVVLGLLLAFVHNIVLVSGFISVHFFFNYWTQWLSNVHFTIALDKTREMRLGNMRVKVLAIMERYWLRRPQFGRIVVLMFFSCVAFSLAVGGAIHPEARKRLLFQLSAYTVLILTILIGEVVIFLWRYRRNQSMEEAMDSREELQHA